jgi:hypothetical protein
MGAVMNINFMTNISLVAILITLACLLVNLVMTRGYILRRILAALAVCAYIALHVFGIISFLRSYD